jgi:hypothetical protein
MILNERIVEIDDQVTKNWEQQQDTYMHNLQLQKDVDSAHQKPHLYTLPLSHVHTNEVTFEKGSLLSICFLCMSSCKRPSPKVKSLSQ